MEVVKNLKFEDIMKDVVERVSSLNNGKAIVAVNKVKIVGVGAKGERTVNDVFQVVINHLIYKDPVAKKYERLVQKSIGQDIGEGDSVEVVAVAQASFTINIKASVFEDLEEKYPYFYDAVCRKVHYANATVKSAIKEAVTNFKDMLANVVIKHSLDSDFTFLQRNGIRVDDGKLVGGELGLYGHGASNNKSVWNTKTTPATILIDLKKISANRDKKDYDGDEDKIYLACRAVVNYRRDYKETFFDCIREAGLCDDFIFEQLNREHIVVKLSGPSEEFGINGDAPLADEDPDENH